MNIKIVRKNIHEHLKQIYGEALAQIWTEQFVSLVLNKTDILSTKDGSVENNNCIDLHTSLLITYADSLKSQDLSPIETLTSFLKEHVGQSISTVHLLPFYPASSDDGFSVIDPTVVDPNLGSWDDISQLNGSYRLMFDLVANHLSQYNESIQKYLEDDKDFADFAIEVKGDEDISQVFRPRSLPLFSQFESKNGRKKLLWTTFSSDQIDINYSNPKVLLFILDVLLTYVSRGASLVRLDAIAFIWKELGTSCIHHKKTHSIIQFFRWVLAACVPGTGLITETNVPHEENISYFGNGHNEAALVYNFPLPPLTLHTFITKNSSKLSEWASTLTTPSDQTTYFNFLASHDGIGIVPAKGILTNEEINHMAEHVKAQKGFVSYKSEGDGTQSPYELNCSYLSALSGLTPDETNDIKAKRFIASQAIMLSLRGISGIYIHSLLGSENYVTSPDILNHPRRINREKLDSQTVNRELKDPRSLRSLVFFSYLKLLDIHKKEKAFRAKSHQIICFSDPRLFIVLRIAEVEDEHILCIINVSEDSIAFDFTSILEQCELDTQNLRWYDLVTKTPLISENFSHQLHIYPYQVCWLKS